MSRKDDYDSTKDNRVYKALHKLFHAGCSYCPWHRAENQGRKPKHGDDKKRKHRQ